MKNILAILVLAGLTVMATGCGSLTCADLEKMGKENRAAMTAALSAKNKSDATTQRDIIAKNCKAMEGMATLKCKFEGATEEKELTDEELKKGCKFALEAIDLYIKALPN